MTNRAKSFIEQFDSISSPAVFVQDTSRAQADDAEIIKSKITTQEVSGSPEITDKLNRDVDVLQKVLQNRKLGGSSAFQAIGGHVIDTGTDEEDPAVDMGHSHAARFMGDVSVFYAAESIQEGEAFDNLKKGAGRQLLGILQQFTGPFYGAVEPFAKAGAEAVGLGVHGTFRKVSSDQLEIAQDQEARGFKYALKAKGDDSIAFFKKESEIDPYLKKWSLKKEWSCPIDHLVLK